MSVEPLEQQVPELRRVVAELQRKVAVLESRPKDNWLPAVLGRIKDDPDFREVIRFGQQFRETGRFPDDSTDEAEPSRPTCSTPITSRFCKSRTARSGPSSSGTSSAPVSRTSPFGDQLS